MKKIITLIPVFFVLFAGAQKEKADLIVYNGTIYTVNADFATAGAMVIRAGKILDIGEVGILNEKYQASGKLDLEGKFVYPGFIDAHAHFVGYGTSLQTVNLVGTKSWEEVVERVETFAKTNKHPWLLGRGWDQNDWAQKDFPTNTLLNKFNFPVLLSRIDGHAAIANNQALAAAGITTNTKVDGGDVILDGNRIPTGVLIDNAIDLVQEKIPGQTKQQFKDAVLQAQKNCFAVGLTTVDDCGLSAEAVEAIKALHKAGALKMRLYVMLSDNPANYQYLEKSGIIKTGRLHVRGFKLYGDGALGSRGACLLEPYRDQPGYTGFLLSKPAHFDSMANRIYRNGFQMCTHAIGDSGNRTILNVYAKHLKGKNDRRWRIEHAQVINKKDFNLFGNYSIIPSVQPTHATSDMYWAEDRLGSERVKGAYAFQQLLQENGWLPLGTDFPVEDISPFKTFYAAVVRKDEKGFPAGGYQVENALRREQAIRGMTIWAAMSNFEENEKGSLEKGKLADFIVLDQDLLKIAEDDILKTSVLKTFVGGEKVFDRSLHKP